MPKRAIESGSKVTLEVEAPDVWPDGKFTFSLHGHPAMITIPEDSPQIVKVEPPAKVKANRIRDVPD